MIDHIGMNVKDLAESKAFFLKALAPLGCGLIMDYEQAVGIGSPGKPFFWIVPGEKRAPIHVAFVAADRAQVDAFYQAALAAGGQDNGKPGLRAQYHPDYYGAFVLDLDGNNIEAVCHKPL